MSKQNKKSIPSRFLLEAGAHPLGIRPLGNLYVDGSAHRAYSMRTKGLGAFAVLPDEILLAVMGSMPAETLSLLGRTSKIMYCWCTHEEFWKRLVLGEMNGRFRWYGKTWRQTYACNRRENSADAVDADPWPACPFSAAVGPSCAVLYSDVLYHSWFCASLQLRPEWLCVENIDRRSRLSVHAFQRDYEVPNRPVVITDALQSWPAMKTWSPEWLQEKFGDVVFRAEAMDISLRDYFHYAESVVDDCPLYLFDKQFPQTTSLHQDYHVPEYFQEDLFHVLGEELRPDYRWLIVGPEKSGSSFHKDPNATSAWNATITGSKKWILFPPDKIPPGVHPSRDGSEVATPASLVEWFMHYYADARKLDPIECITRPGDLVFVPSGWWHIVVNLEPHTIAVTQNFVSSANLDKVLAFLHNNKNQISGVPCERAEVLGELFENALREKKPELWKEYAIRREELEARKRKRREECGLGKHVKVFQWDAAMRQEEQGEGEGEFGFDFGV